MMDHGSGEVSVHSRDEANEGVVDEEKVLGSAERWEYLANQTDFWSVGVSTDHVLDHGCKSGRCSQCEGIEVGWARGSSACYLCSCSCSCSYKG